MAAAQHPPPLLRRGTAGSRAAAVEMPTAVAPQQLPLDPALAAARPWQGPYESVAGLCALSAQLHVGVADLLSLLGRTSHMSVCISFSRPRLLAVHAVCSQADAAAPMPEFEVLVIVLSGLRNW